MTSGAGPGMRLNVEGDALWDIKSKSSILHDGIILVIKERLKRLIL